MIRYYRQKYQRILILLGACIAMFGIQLNPLMSLLEQVSTVHIEIEVPLESGTDQIETEEKKEVDEFEEVNLLSDSQDDFTYARLLDLLGNSYDHSRITVPPPEYIS